MTSPSRRKVQQRNAKNRDRMHRRIHRNNDYNNSGYNSATDRQGSIFCRKIEYFFFLLKMSIFLAIFFAKY